MNNIESSTTIYANEVNTMTKEDYPFFISSMKYGIIAGGVIALFFFLLQSMGMEDAIGLKYAGYGILGIILAIGLTDYDRFLSTGTTFRNGMTYAAQIALFTGLTMIAINVITFLSGSGLVFSKYGVEATSFPKLLMISGALFLEIMVAGLIFTFIVLQYLKSRRDYKS